MKRKLEYGASVKRKNSLFLILSICLIVFIVAITVLIKSFNNLMSTHDQSLSNEICIIMTEKMDIAIDSMNKTSEGIAQVLSSQNYKTVKQAYDSIDKKTLEDELFLSMGLIDENKNIYASESEIREFEKWNLVETAELANPVSMSVPYRSMLCGQPVVTLFSKFQYGNGKNGWVFVTYRFKDLQDIANTGSMDNEIEVELVNSKSFNIIVCVSPVENTVGSWKNAYLMMQSLDNPKSPKFANWMEALRNGEDNVSLTYYNGGIHYTQSSTKIDTMPDWYLVVRIPSSKLSATMEHFRNHVINFVLVLFVLMVILFLSMYKLNQREKQLLEEISEHDSLTGLFNRRAFQLLARNWIEQGKELAVIFFDVDHFKKVNDNLGHDAGDELLVQFSDILSKCLGKDSVLFRLGGDEFIALVDVNDEEKIDDKLLRALKEVHKISLGTAVDIDEEMSFSAGIAKYPSDAKELDELIKCADEALYQIKKNGRDGYCWYENIE